MLRLPWLNDVGSSRPWVVKGLWLFLAFVCYEMLRQHMDRLYSQTDGAGGQYPPSTLAQNWTDSAYEDSVSHSEASASPDWWKFAVPPTINEKEVYATFLSTRIGSNAAEGEFEEDWYYNATRVLIHRLLRNPVSRSRRRVVVQASLNALTEGSYH
jgi:hypothetical protein